jgi:4-hydroxy-3-polyprenylbenzoate decarboxylase
MSIRRLIVGMSGATGAIYGIRLLEVLEEIEDIETHLIMSSTAGQTILQETGYNLKQVESLADVTYRFRDIGAAISSGSFKTMGMVIIPCSMKTLSGVANSYSDNLLLRGADVVLKDRRKLVLVTRETPLHLGHLKLMVQVTEMGGIIMPPMPAFYHRPKTLDDIINQTVNRVLDMFEIDLGYDLFERWQGMTHASDVELPIQQTSAQEPGEVAEDT